MAAVAASLMLGSGAAHAQAPHDACQNEQWAVGQGVVLNLPAAWQLSQGAGRGVRRGSGVGTGWVTIR